MICMVDGPSKEVDMIFLAKDPFLCLASISEQRVHK